MKLNVVGCVALSLLGGLASGCNEPGDKKAKECRPVSPSACRLKQADIRLRLLHRPHLRPGDA